MEAQLSPGKETRKSMLFLNGEKWESVGLRFVSLFLLQCFAQYYFETLYGNLHTFALFRGDP